MGRAEDIQALRALKDSGKLSPEKRTQVLEQLAALEDEGIGDWAAAAPHALESQPEATGTGGAPGSLGVKGVIGKDGTSYGAGGQVVQNLDPQATASAADAEAERVAGMLDPRFSLVPQVLALQPATGHPVSDDAARQQWQAGDKNAVIVYEPPVAVVQKHLLENPALLRAIRPDAPPSTEEIANLNATSPLYTEVADYMWRKTKEAADQSGRPVLRQSKLPWLSEDPEMPQTLDVRVQNAATEGNRKARAFVMGTDDTAMLGIGRAIQERVQPESMLDRPTMGVNESVPQKTSDINAWEAQQNPLSHGVGQLYGGVANWGVADRLWKGIQEGGGMLANAVAKTRLGAVVADLAPGWMKGAAGVLGDAATGGAAAAGVQAGQEVVDAAGRGEMGDVAEASERVKDVGLVGGALSAGGGLAGRAARAGANAIRDSSRYSDRYGRGLVRSTEPNLDWSPSTALTGPRLNQETKGLIKQSSEGGYVPSDVLAEEIAGPVGKAAADNSRISADRAAAARAGYHVSPEGRAQQPVRQAFEEAFRGVRSHYQPQAGGGLRAVNDRPPPELKVFNSLVGEASTTAREGALKLTPEQAERFLTPRTQVQLFKDDLEKAARSRAGKPDDRAAYLANKPARARDGINEEIEADIDDLIGFDQQGVPRTVDKRSAEYKKAEQQAIRTRVDAETVLEPFGGSLGKYLEQRGLDGVYVTPRALDAERLDRLIELHGADSRLGKAAALDRRQFSAGGKKGGYHDMLEQQRDEAARHAKIEKRVAPDGDAFQPVAGLYQANPGEKQLVDDVRALADQAGVREQLERMRGLQDTLAVSNRARARGPDGRPRSGGLFNPTNWRDVAPLRAFPVLRALEGPLGPLQGGNAGRAALLGRREDADRQRADVTTARGRYEAARDRRLKEIEQEKADAKKENERRKNEPIRRRR